MNLVSTTLPIAKLSRRRKDSAKLFVWDDGNSAFTTISGIVDFLEEGDVVVVNNAATIPSSFQGIHEQSNSEIEVRLAMSLSPSFSDPKKWRAVVLGAGDWKMKTEDRPKPPKISANDILVFGELYAIVTSQRGKQLLDIEFIGQPNEIWRKIYEQGKPIQYSYLTENLELWDQQTIFSSIPASFEPNSAAFHLSWDLMFELKKKGVKLTSLTHAISISSTGNEKLDESLPFPERYEISQETANVINHAIQSSKRIVAIGTSVTRALETSAINNNGKIMADTNITNLFIDNKFERKVVSGILTGMHVPDESHIQLIAAFVDRDEIERNYNIAVKSGFLWHEYGDVSLLIKPLPTNH